MYLQLIGPVVIVVDKIEELLSARIVVGRESGEKHDANGKGSEKAKVIWVKRLQCWSFDDDWTRVVEGGEVAN